MACALGIGKTFVNVNGSQILGIWYGFVGMKTRDFQALLEVPRTPYAPRNSQDHEDLWNLYR